MNAPLATLGRWFPSPFLKGAFAMHVIGVVLVLWDSATWPLVVAVLVAVHVALSTVGLDPRGALLGPNLTRLPPAAAARGEVAITIDDGPDPEVTPRVLALLAERGVRATFFCIGERVEACPGLVREMRRQGHAIENHTAHHRYHFSTFGPWRLAAEVEGAQRSIERVTGQRPTFFRAPAGLRNPLLQPVLSRVGVRLASWTRRGFDTVAGDPALVLARLCRDLAAGDILLLHDGHAARGPSGEPVILEVLPALLDRIAAAGLRPVTLPEACAAGATPP
jgi:peptidoglycan/xylan/chitin deacetylase (PgdA/CDA1 family)